MNQPKILITGGTGFAGSHLVEQLLAQGYTDIHVTAFSSKASLVHTLLPQENIHQADLTNLESTVAVFQAVKPDQIYHLASFAFVGKSFERAHEVLSNNITLQQNVLQAVHTVVPDARLLVIGSAEEYGISFSEDEIPYTESHPLRPINPYAVSKATQSLLAFSYFISFELDIVMVKPFNHIGERQTPDFAVPAFTRQIVAIERGEQTELSVGNLDAIRDFTDVIDMVKAYIILMELGEKGEVYNVGTGVGIKMSDLLTQLINLAKVPITTTTDPSRFRPHDIPKMIANSAKIKALGWQPTIKLSDTLERIVNWYRNN